LNYWRSYPDKFSSEIDAYNILDTYIVDYMNDLRKNVYMNIINDPDIEDIFKKVTN
jgi:hypothetical protein